MMNPFRPGEERAWASGTQASSRHHNRDPTPTVLKWAILIILGTVLLVVSSPATEGEGFASDFEWKVPVSATASGYDQYVEAIEVDEVTGDTYLIWTNVETFSGNPGPEAVVCSRINTTSMELEKVASVPYLGTSRYHLVHNGTWFLFYSTEDRDGQRVAHLRVAGEASDSLVWNQTYILDVLGVYMNRIQMVTRSGILSGDDRCDLVSIDLQTLEWTWLPLFDLASYSHDRNFLLRDGIVYFATYLATEDWEHDFVELNTYVIGSLEWKEPILLCWWDFVYWAWFDFGVDSEGNVHLLMQSNSTLMKFSPDGELLAIKKLSPPLNTEGAAWHYGQVFINGSDFVYIIGAVRVNSSSSWYIVSQTISGDYASAPVSHMVSEDIGYAGTVLAVVNMSGRIQVCFHYQIENNYRVGVSYQIDPTPDLALPRRYLKVEETSGAEEPVEVTMDIRNVGGAASTSHRVTILRRPNDGGPFSEVISRLEEVPLDPGGHYWLSVRVRIPKGNCLLRVQVHDVTPFENFRDNNVVDVNVYIGTNNPPDLVVLAPLNGTVVDSVLMLTGVTTDIDGDANLTTSISGLPGDLIETDGVGQWSLTGDLTAVPSGDYHIEFRATDGEDPSRAELRWVRVDHPVDSLILDGVFPGPDTEILVGEDQWFFFNVTDRFSRKLQFQWFLDGVLVANTGAFHRFVATEAGSFIVRVNVTNGRMSMENRWNLTVRVPSVPHIVDWNPSDPVDVMKQESINLSIAVDNPDRLPVSIVWLVDGLPDHNGCGLYRTLMFANASIHNVSVVLVAGLASDTVGWMVRVLNTPPDIRMWSPQDLHLETRCPSMINFSVTTTDEDGDTLLYTWGSDQFSIPLHMGESCSVEFTKEGQYQVSVVVSDGDDQTRIAWMVDVEGDGTHVTNPGRYPLIFLVLFLAMAIAASIHYFISHGRLGGGGDQVARGCPNTGEGEGF